MQKLMKERLKVLERRRKRYRHLVIITAFFGVAVMGGVVWGLGRSGIAMTGEATCGIEEHKHSGKCYKEVLVCQEPESEGHEHGENCYEEEEILVCPEQETKEHTHGSECYEKEVKLICRKEESKGHQHSDGCYEQELSCESEEHTHEEDCFIDLKADIEKPSEWDKQYKDVKWKDAWGPDLATAAKEQVGYKESTKNYKKAKDGSHKGYTRYGQFSGDEYADWDASFVNFCIYFAGMSETDIFPNTQDTAKWYNKFHKVNGSYLTGPDGYEPEKGDIVFFEKKKEETDFQMGIVASYDKEEKVVRVIEGNSGNAVKENKYSAGDKEIFAYLKTTAVEESYKDSQKTPEGTDEVSPDGDNSEENGDLKGESGVQDEPEAENPDEQNPDGDNAEDSGENEEEAKEDEVQEPDSGDGMEEQGKTDYICGKEEHTHDESCYDENQELTCEKEEHAHDDSCVKAEEETPKAEELEDEEPKSPEESRQNKVVKDNTLYINDTFAYRIDSFKLAFHVKGKAVLPGLEEVEGASEEEADNKQTSKNQGKGNGIEAENQAADETSGTEPEDEETDKEEQPAVQTSMKEFNTESKEVVDDEAGDKTSDTDGDRSPENQSAEKNENAGMENSNTKIENGQDASDADNSLTADGNEDKKEELEFKVDILDKDSESYQSFSDYARKEEEEGYEQILLQIMQCSLTYGGEELDLSGCEMTAEITPTQELKTHVVEAGKTVREDADEVSSGTLASEDDRLEGDTDKEIIVSAYGVPEDSADSQVEVGNAVVNSEKLDVEKPLMTFAMSGRKMAVRVQATPNPEFTVQYYSKLNRVDAQSSGTLPVINTEKDGNGTGGNLPKNEAKTPPLLYLTPDENGAIRTVPTWTKIYADRENQTYYKQPNIDYMNALLENTSYELTQIWMYRPEDSHTDYEDTAIVCGEKEHTHSEECYEGNWTSYDYVRGKTHFTNRKEVADKEGYIWVSEKAIIRFIYETVDREEQVGASFYDYDISSKYHDDASKNMNGDTADGGINHYERTPSTAAKYAFGGDNSGTKYGKETWANNNINNNLNMTNKPQGVYMGCTFGMANGISESGSVIFADGISAPEHLFGGEAQDGKHIYDGELTYSRIGDTHTLTTAKIKGDAAHTISGLNQFQHPQDKYPHIWTNNFWPMDKVPNEKRNDILFGESKDYTHSAGQWGSLPLSDDGKNHNSYFGMSYQVDFELSDEYVGPLEYYFFGDDDMWVFLEGDGIEGQKLVCDIGGVHSSVGEYVNLWDYLQKGSSGKYKLTFFYTERGASGSTCWMQFTLPSVTSRHETKEEDYGRLKVKKAVVQNGSDELYKGDDEFEFEIRLSDANGGTLPDDYAYTKYDAKGNPMDEESGLVLHDGSTFYLKNGEYIEIKYIPKDAIYTVTEKNGSVHIGNVDYTCDTDINISNQSPVSEEALKKKEASGSIISNGTVNVLYTNSFYLYELPSTGDYGIYLFISGGILLLLMAGAALTAYRKRYGEVLRG